MMYNALDQECHIEGQHGHKLTGAWLHQSFLMVNLLQGTRGPPLSVLDVAVAKVGPYSYGVTNKKLVIVTCKQ